jgi:WD40 repeat protein
MDPSSSKLNVLGRHKGAAVEAAFTPAGDFLLTIGWDNELACWDMRTMRRAFVMSVEGADFQLRGDGLGFAVQSAAGVKVHQFAPPSAHWDFPEDLGGRLSSAAFSPDSRWLAASGAKFTSVWDLADKGQGALVKLEDVAQLEFTSDQLFAHYREFCARWRVSLGTNSEEGPRLEPLPIAIPKGFVSLSLAADGVVFTGSLGSRKLPFSELNSTSPAGDWKPTVDGISTVSPDGHWLGMYRAFSSEFQFYRLPELEHVTTLKISANITGCMFSPRGNEIAVCSARGAEFWSTATWQRTHTLTGFVDALYAGTGDTCWLWAERPGAGLYRTATGELLLPLAPGMRPLATSPDGRFLAVAIEAQRLQIWDIPELRSQLRAYGLDWAER